MFLKLVFQNVQTFCYAFFVRRHSANAHELENILHFHIGDAITIAKELVEERETKFDLISLSNALEWMSVEQYANIIEIMSHCLTSGGIILHRFHLTEDEMMINQIETWKQVLLDTNDFIVLDADDDLHRIVFENERSKFGFEPHCISISIRK